MIKTSPDLPEGEEGLTESSSSVCKHFPPWEGLREV